MSDGFWDWLGFKIFVFVLIFAGLFSCVVLIYLAACFALWQVPVPSAEAIWPVVRSVALFSFVCVCGVRY